MASSFAPGVTGAGHHWAIAHPLTPPYKDDPAKGLLSVLKSPADYNNTVIFECETTPYSMAHLAMGTNHTRNPNLPMFNHEVERMVKGYTAAAAAADATGADDATRTAPFLKLAQEGALAYAASIAADAAPATAPAVALTGRQVAIDTAIASGVHPPASLSTAGNDNAAAAFGLYKQLCGEFGAYTKKHGGPIGNSVPATTDTEKIYLMMHNLLCIQLACYIHEKDLRVVKNDEYNSAVEEFRSDKEHRQAHLLGQFSLFRPKDGAGFRYIRPITVHHLPSKIRSMESTPMFGGGIQSGLGYSKMVNDVFDAAKQSSNPEDIYRGVIQNMIGGWHKETLGSASGQFGGAAAMSSMSSLSAGDRLRAEIRRCQPDFGRMGTTGGQFGGAAAVSGHQQHTLETQKRLLGSNSKYIRNQLFAWRDLLDAKKAKEMKAASSLDTVAKAAKETKITTEYDARMVWWNDIMTSTLGAFEIMENEIWDKWLKGAQNSTKQLGGAGMGSSADFNEKRIRQTEKYFRAMARIDNTIQDAFNQLNQE